MFRGFFFMRLITFFIFIGLVALACGGLYNLGFRQGYSQALITTGADVAPLPEAAGFLSPPLAGPGPFLAMAGILFLGFLALGTVGLIFGRRKWARAREWRHHYHRHGGYPYWGDPYWRGRDFPPEGDIPPDDRAETV